MCPPARVQNLVQVVQEVQDVLDARRRLVEVARVQEAVARVQEADMLEECLKGDYIQLAVQPIITAKETTQTFAYECLLRSDHSVLNGPIEHAMV